jgi:hypothetical protein
MKDIRKALVIGNNKYKYTPLPQAEKDAKDLSDFLKSADFTVTEKHNLTYDSFWEALNEFCKQIKDAKVRLFYFSGHGINFEGNNYLIPTDIILNKPESIYKCINLNVLLKRLNISNNTTNIILLDCCNADPSKFKFKSNDYIGFTNIEALSGSIIGFAAKAGSLALTDSKLRNSVYTSKLLENLKRPNLTIEKILKNTMKDVVDFTNSKQYPAYQSEFTGEFYFIGGEERLPVKIEEEEKEFKGYKDFIKTLKHYKQNAKFELVEKEEILTKKIGFELYKEYDVVESKIVYYLYLYQGINQTATYDYLMEKYKSQLSNKNLLIFLPKENDQKNFSVRKKNITNKFNPLKVFYIDEFIKKHCTPNLFIDESNNEDFLNLSNFVLPSYKLGTNNENIDSYIEEWLNKDNDPLLIIKGDGGIGKTTFAYYIADKTKEIKGQPSVLFIDSIQVKDNLLNRRNQFLPITLFDFYEAFRYTSSSIITIDEDLFKLNIDSGNILLIIDGLDEVIAKIPDFDVNNFLKSIYDITKDIGSGKVIITCRTYFWDTFALSTSNQKVIELLPFNKSQIELFFKRSFYQEPNLEKKAIKLAEEFKSPGNSDDYIYHPYVLDVIRSILKSGQGHLNIDQQVLTSNYLNQSINNDYIIYHICERERKRIGQIITDDQVKFFIQFAIEKRGIIDTANLGDFINSSLKKHIDDTNVEAFKAHPFLLKSDKTIKFKYDFLTDFFKSIYVSIFFTEKGISEEITDYLREILIENCRSGAGMFGDIVARIFSWNEMDILQVSDIIEKIHKSNIEDDSKRKAIATVFNISIQINRKFYANNIENNTQLLKSLFLKNSSNVIEKLCIINLVNSDTKVKFDFSDLYFSKCYFKNYDSFWDCKMNERTRFFECHLLNLKFEKKTLIDRSIFQNCIKDNQVDRVFEQNTNLLSDRTENARQFLSDFFHLFFSNGRLGRQWETKVIKPRFAGINQSVFEYNKVIKLMKKRNVVIITEESEGPKFAINEMYKEDVTKFVKDGTNSEITAILINELIH